MGLFKKKREDFVDLGAQYKKRQEKISNLKESLSESQGEGSESPNAYQENSSGGIFGIFGSANSSSNSSTEQNSNYADFSSQGSDPETEGSLDGMNEKRKKLTKRILDMTQKLEDISNQLYRLQQRVEVIERKSGVGNGGY